MVKKPDKNTARLKRHAECARKSAALRRVRA